MQTLGLLGVYYEPDMKLSDIPTSFMLSDFLSFSIF